MASSQTNHSTDNILNGNNNNGNTAYFNHHNHSGSSNGFDSKQSPSTFMNTCSIAHNDQSTVKNSSNNGSGKLPENRSIQVLPF